MEKSINESKENYILPNKIISRENLPYNIKEILDELYKDKFIYAYTYFNLNWENKVSEFLKQNGVNEDWVIIEWDSE